MGSFVLALGEGAWLDLEAERRFLPGRALNRSGPGRRELLGLLY